MSTLRTACGRQDRQSHRAWLLDPSSDQDRCQLDELARDPAVVVVDTVLEQLDELVRSREPALRLSGPAAGQRVDALLDGSLPEFFGRWVLYPWSGRLLHVLPEPLHRELRLERNRYKITAAEHARLLPLRVAVAGLSVGGFRTTCLEVCLFLVLLVIESSRPRRGREDFHSTRINQPGSRHDRARYVLEAITLHPPVVRRLVRRLSKTSRRAA